MFRKNNSWGFKNSDDGKSESQLYEKAFSRYVLEPKVLSDSVGSDDELSTEARANIAGALGLCKPFGLRT